MLYMTALSLSLALQGPVTVAHGHKVLSSSKVLKGNSVFTLFCEPAVMTDTTLLLHMKTKNQRREVAIFMAIEVLNVTVGG